MLRDQYSGALSINSPLFEIKAHRWWLPRSLTQSWTITLKPNTKAQRPKHDIYRMQPVYMCHKMVFYLLRTSLNLIPTLFNCVPEAKYLDVNIQHTNPSQTDGRILTFLSFSLNLTSFPFVFICTSFFFKRWYIWMRDPSIPTGGQLHTMQNHFQLVKQSRF